MSFVSVPPDPVSPPGSTMPGDGWWPDIDCNAMRDALRLGELVTHARLLGALEGGLLTVEGELAIWRAAREAEGCASLAEVEPARTIGGKPRAVVLYTRAVRCAAAAELAETHRDVTATTHGQARADDEKLTAADYRRMVTEAVRDLIGTTRVAIELI
ncbi:head completion/stabilization protein [Novosphingobium capsulatum]|uniref:head completion/stabilization protein n=1 Tax=Novosphingobium capsulatum TaxID=13688 RepID=UPI000A02B5AC|nr:head completion/stabilization protein [Novosphingobium capsulatum]WQD92544.1 head completion/stabilization protein [Novosphingobium capsulatum]